MFPRGGKWLEDGWRWPADDMGKCMRNLTSGLAHASSYRLLGWDARESPKKYLEIIGDIIQKPR